MRSEQPAPAAKGSWPAAFRVVRAWLITWSALLTVRAVGAAEALTIRLVAPGRPDESARRRAVKLAALPQAYLHTTGCPRIQQ